MSRKVRFIAHRGISLIVCVAILFSFTPLPNSVSFASANPVTLPRPAEAISSPTVLDTSSPSIALARNLSTDALPSPTVSGESSSAVSPAHDQQIFADSSASTSLPANTASGPAIRITSAVSGTPEVIELAPAIHENSTQPGVIFFSREVLVNYGDGPAIISSHTTDPYPVAADDEAIITVFPPSGSPATLDYKSFTHDFGPVDLSTVLGIGTNRVRLELKDLILPERGCSPFYLIVGADTISPTISNVWWRQDGEGRTLVEATITDNVAVAAASLWWNGQEFPMQSLGGDRYYVIVPKEPNGIVGNFRITAVDPSGNLGFWPDSGTQAERIRYLKWAGQKKNTLSVGEPVNSATGSFFTQHQDLFAPGPGMPFEFKRTYNSVAASLDGPLGFGWTHNFNIHLQVVDDPLLHGVVVTYEDGRTANFEADGSGYRAPPGDHNVLSHEGSGFALTRPDQVKYHFDGSGKLTGVEDRNHNTLQFAYTGDDLTQITDTAGRVYQFEYTNHRIIKITDVLGRTYQYTYDGNGNLQTYQGPEGGLLQYTYDGEHWLLSITDPNGHVFVTNTYDSRGRVTTQQDASGNSSSIAYLDEWHVQFTDNEGKVTTHTYDDDLRIVEDKDANGQSITYQYDADDNATRVTDRQGHATTFTYDSRGNVLTRQDALSQTAILHYDAQNNLTYKRDESGAETTYEYDTRGNLTHIHDAEGGGTWMTYDSHGLLLTLRDAGGSLTQLTYDSQGNLQTVEDALHNVTRFAHDGAGRQTMMTDANSHVVQFTYDRNDRVTAITDPKNKPTAFAYDAVGNLIRVTDRRNYTTTYQYNENDSLIKVIDPLGNFASFAYDKMYHRKTFTNTRGYTTAYEYDSVYNLTQVIDAKGNPTRFGYDADGNLIALTDALTQITRFDYDALHRVVTVTDALNGVTAYTYDPVGRPARVRDPKGGLTRFEYDRLGRLRVIADALSNATTFVYDPMGRLTTLTNARGFATRYRYDAIGQLIQQTDPLSHTLRLGYDGVGNVISMTNPRDNSTLFAYDANDNLAQVTDALSGRLAYTYDAEDNRLSATNQNGNQTTFAYDPLGNLTRVTLPMSQPTAFEYDANSNLVAVTNAKGKTTRLAYDALDLLASRTDPLTFVTTYTHDALRRLTRVTDAEGNPTNYGYDALDRLVQVTDALNGRTAYEYDPLGNLTAITDANSRRTTFDVDLLGRVTRETNPLGNVWQYAYDPVGNLVRRTDAKGVATQYTFDADDRLTGIAYPSGPGVSLGYDENDNLTGLGDASGATAFAYDALDRLTQAKRSAGILAGQTLNYAYDAAGNRTRIAYPDGKAVRYAYSANEWLSSVTDPLAGVTGYTYDAVGLPTRIQNPNGTWTDYAYDDADRLVSLFNGKPEASSNVISSFDYTLDKVGNRTRAVEKTTRGQVITWDKRYTYDPLYRLTQSVFTPDYKPAQVLTSTFTYDAVGNRLAMATNIQDKPNTPPLPALVTTNYTYNAANQMLAAGPTRFSYDANGNRVSMTGAERVINYAYDFENRLTGAQTFDVQPNGKWKPDSTLDYSYDGLGRRMQRGVVDKGVRKTASFLYDALGYDMLAQYVDPGSPRTTYYYRDLTQILSRHETQSEGAGNGLQYFHHYDGLGNVSAWTNQAGREAQEYTYAPYGRLMDNNGPDNSSNRTDPHNSLTWSGKPWDQETELYYFGARDYDPTTGTWLTQDPYRGRLAEPMTLHRYQYVWNNPIKLVDKYGFDGGPRYTFPGLHAKDWYTAGFVETRPMQHGPYIWDRIFPDQYYDYDIRVDETTGERLKCRYRQSPDSPWYDCYEGGQGSIDKTILPGSKRIRFIVGTFQSPPEVQFYADKFQGYYDSNGCYQESRLVSPETFKDLNNRCYDQAGGYWYKTWHAVYEGPKPIGFAYGSVDDTGGWGHYYKIYVGWSYASPAGQTFYGWYSDGGIGPLIIANEYKDIQPNDWTLTTQDWSKNYSPNEAMLNYWLSLLPSKPPSEKIPSYVPK